MADRFPACLLSWRDRYIEPATGMVRRVVRREAVYDAHRNLIRVIHDDGTAAVMGRFDLVTIYDPEEATG